MVRERLKARKGDEASRIRQHVVETLGPVGDPYRQMEAHTERARREAGPMYAEAYAQPMLLTPEIASIMQTPAFQDAVPHAVRNIRNAQRDPDALGFAIGNDGQVLPDMYQSLSTEGFDQVIRAMRDQGRRAAEVNPVTGQVINNTNSVHINARAGDLRDQLAAQNGAYRDAIGVYADELSQRDALEAGMKIGTRTGHEVNAWARQNPASAHPSYATGARDFLADEASRVEATTPTANGAAALRKVLGDRTKQDALSGVMGDQASLPALQDRLEAEHQAHMLWADVEGNSKTAMRQASEDSFNAAAGAPKGALSWRGMLSNAINDIGAGVGEQTRRDVKERVAEFTTEPNPEALRGFMAEIAAKSGRDREAAAALHRSGLLGTKSYGANILPAYPSIYSDQAQYDPRYDDNEADDFVFDPGF
ncbi:hypothetical protein [Sphingomonas mucosissima]|nr:hypothetical protein [Sphingomonas mucosissima]